eukprot:5584640-Pleurochrysis_carterae.AAC.1
MVARVRNLTKERERQREALKAEQAAAHRVGQRADRPCVNSGGLGLPQRRGAGTDDESAILVILVLPSAQTAACLMRQPATLWPFLYPTLRQLPISVLESQTKSPEEIRVYEVRCSPLLVAVCARSRSAAVFRPQVHVRVLLDDLRQADAYSAAVGKTVRALLQIRATEAAKAEAATATTMAAELAMAGAAAAEGGVEAANEVAMAAAEMAAAAARHKHVAAGKGLGEVSPEGAYAAALTAPQHRSPLTARQPSLSLQEQLRSLQAEQEEEFRHFQHLQHAHQQMAESNRL